MPWGIKGKGMKVGIIDTGVDYRHPALGGGFGPGRKIAGGYAFTDDDGNAISSPDPLTTCLEAGTALTSRVCQPEDVPIRGEI